MTYHGHSNLRLPIPPHQAPPRRNQQARPHEETRARPNIRMRIVATVIFNQRARKRRPRKTRKTHNRKQHAHSHPGHFQVLSLVHLANARRPERLNDCTPTPIEDGKHVQCGDAVDADPGKHHDTAEKSERDEDVHGADFVSVVRRQHAEDEAHADLDEQEIDGLLVACAKDVAAIGSNVKKGKVQAPKGKEHGDAIQGKGQFAETRPVDYRACFTGRQPSAVEGNGEEVCSEHDEADDADCPGEAKTRETLLYDDGEDNATSARPQGCEAH